MPISMRWATQSDICSAIVLASRRNATSTLNVIEGVQCKFDILNGQPTIAGSLSLIG